MHLQLVRHIPVTALLTAGMLALFAFEGRAQGGELEKVEFDRFRDGFPSGHPFCPHLPSVPTDLIFVCPSVWN